MKPMPSCSSADRSDRVLAIASELRSTLAAHAAETDTLGAFPTKSLQDIRGSGLMGLTVDRRYDGLGASFSTMSKVAQLLGEGCASTAMIWAMHCQQVATIADHASQSLCDAVLPRIASNGLYIASVTSEQGKGGELLTAMAPLQRHGDNYLLVRDAPVVTGGAQADAFLATMRLSQDASPSSVVLAFADRASMDVALRSAWTSMGMRGTQSAALSLRGQIPSDHIISHPKGFKHIVVSTMAPVGHIAWAATWTGAARGAFRRFIALLRDPRQRASFPVRSDLFAERLSQIRLQLDTMSALLGRVTDRYDQLRQEHGVGSPVFSAPSFNLQINNLKLYASETSFSVLDNLIQLAGLRHGYLTGSALGLERTFRDLRSAALMYSNDKLHVVNGKLALLDSDVSLA
ncbi:MULTISPECIES: acyl-CoA dehydrogenase family protein [unclassified Bradyrhizobium]|uniref:acyl-CoA dehydrogenase family protein n=1 Tax=unclassified Bradyrhizobium TaxID=2631580 RepID=UPI002915EC35|nr:MULTISPECIES: acyl-CoA dehydrogenase family protein [unclassified Bradyrhizobium]